MSSSQSFFNSDAFFAIAVIVMILQFIVGVVQIVGAFIRTLIRLNKGKPLGNLKIYWIMVGSYFLVFILLYLVYLFLDKTTDGADWTEYQSKMANIGLLIKFAYGWIFTAWFIAIWYNIKVVFYKEPVNNNLNA